MLKDCHVHIPIVPDECRIVCEMEMDKLPTHHMQIHVERWVHLGYPPGDFLTAVITNDLKMAVTYADDMNRLLLSEIVRWCYNNIPASCWGSMKNAKQWQQLRQEALVRAVEENLKRREQNERLP